MFDKRKVYERSRANAWSNEDSILKLATAVMRESLELREKFGIVAIEVSCSIFHLIKLRWLNSLETNGIEWNVYVLK